MIELVEKPKRFEKLTFWNCKFKAIKPEGNQKREKSVATHEFIGIDQNLDSKMSEKKNN